jgi:hypothetical protein
MRNAYGFTPGEYSPVQSGNPRLSAAMAMAGDGINGFARNIASLDLHGLLKF